MKGAPYPTNRKGKINSNSEGNTDLADGRSGSAAFQYKSAFKQTDNDLKEFLISDKGFNQEDTDRMMSEGAYDLNNSEFKKWYAESNKGETVSMKKKKKKQ